MARILFVGLGDLGSQIFDALVCLPGHHTFLVAGRNQGYLRQRTNLSTFAAIQRGLYSEVACTHLDLLNVDQTVQTITQFRPDMIFCAATLQRWGILSQLPKPQADRLYQAEMGPWLPLHLAIVYKLMQAVEQAGLNTHVVNATYPDVVHAVLAMHHLAPLTGIGDLANNIPALRTAIGVQLEQPIERVDVRFFAQRSLSYRMSRISITNDLPFHLTALIDGKDVTHSINLNAIFDLLPTTLRRASGHLMTVASATTVMDGLINDRGAITHVPGPNGLPGGYPALINQNRVSVVLPDDFGLQQAIEVNEAGMRLDGIERIDEAGTVFFAQKNMSILKEAFGYECLKMPLSEVEQWADELRVKYLTFANQYL